MRLEINDRVGALSRVQLVPSGAAIIVNFGDRSRGYFVHITDELYPTFRRFNNSTKTLNVTFINPASNFNRNHILMERL